MIKKMLRKFFYNNTKQLLLCIHHVNNCKNTAYNEISVDELLTLTSKKKVISLDEFLQNKKGLVLTFDDGYKDVIEVVYPIMKNKNIPFSIFVNPSTIGKDGYLTLDDLLVLSRDKLCTIGSHSFRHVNFLSLTDIEITNELESSLSFFISKGIMCKSFAFPYGQWDDRVKAVCLESKTFSYFFGVAKGVIDYKRNLHGSIFQRINVSEEIINEFNQ